MNTGTLRRPRRRPRIFLAAVAAAALLPLVGCFPETPLPDVKPLTTTASAFTTSGGSVSITGTKEPGYDIEARSGPFHASSAVAADGTFRIDLPILPGGPHSVGLVATKGGVATDRVTVAATRTVLPGTESISGQVVDATTAAPIGGAVVEYPGLSVTAATDAGGEFRLSGVPPGQALLRITKSGFATQVTTRAPDVAVGGGYRSGAAIRLVPLPQPVTVGVLGGTVTTPRGHRIEIPPGALTGDTPITVADTDAYVLDQDSALFPTVIEVLPTGLEFAVPAKVTLKLWAPTAIPPGNTMEVVWQDQDTLEWTDLVGTVSLDQRHVTFEIDRVSGGGPMIPDELFHFAYRPDGPPRNLHEGPKSQDNCSEGLKVNRADFAHKNGAYDTDFDAWPDIVVEPTFGFLLHQFGPYYRDRYEVPVQPGTRSDIFHSWTTQTYIMEIFLLGKLVGTYKFDLVTASHWTDTVTPGACEPKMCAAPPATPSSMQAERTGATVPCSKSYSWGDPHISTFDGFKYDFQGHGEFVYQRVPELGLEVQARQLPLTPTAKVAINDKVAVGVSGDRIVVSRGAPPVVEVNGSPVTLGANSPTLTTSRGVTVDPSPAGTGTRFVVRWPGDGNRSVTLTAYQRSVTIGSVLARGDAAVGLAGNVNGLRSDDLTTRGGSSIAIPPTYADLYGVFGASWRVTQAESLFDYAPGQTTETFTDRAFPGGRTTIADLPAAVRNAATTTCRTGGVVAEPQLTDCVLDVGTTGDDGFAEVAASLVAESSGQILQYSGGSPAFQPDDATLRGAYTKLAAASGNDIVLSPVIPADLVAYRAVLLPMMQVDFSPSDLASLEAYVRAGGVVMVVGEQAAFPTTNAVFNTMLAALGSSMRLLGGAFASATTTSNIQANAFTAGVSTISYATAGEVDPGSGTSLVKVSPDKTILAVETLGTGRIVLTSDLNAWSDWNSSFTQYDNDLLIGNLLG